MAYSPRYVGLNDIPVQIPDDYTDTQKLSAIEFAEISMELDLNDGIPLSDKQLQDVEPMVISAVKQKATCELAKGAEDPDSVALTDLSSGGSTKSDYATDAFCDRYDEIIMKIEKSSLLGDETGGDISPFVYTTSDPTPTNEYQEYPVDEDSFDINERYG
jgi:hypothetical protein